jgi:hypothetical protein
MVHSQVCLSPFSHSLQISMTWWSSVFIFDPVEAAPHDTRNLRAQSGIFADTLPMRFFGIDTGTPSKTLREQLTVKQGE